MTYDYFSCDVTLGAVL